MPLVETGSSLLLSYLQAGSPISMLPEPAALCATQSRHGSQFPKCSSLRVTRPSLPHLTHPQGWLTCPFPITASSTVLPKPGTGPVLPSATATEKQGQLTSSPDPQVSSHKCSHGEEQGAEGIFPHPGYLMERWEPDTSCSHTWGQLVWDPNTMTAQARCRAHFPECCILQGTWPTHSLS